LIAYRLATGAYHLGIRIAAVFGHQKAKAWLQGRRTAPAEVQKINAKRIKNQRLIWMHAASLGEFEQGKPVLELLRARYPNHFFLVTFFSPSGYERRKDYEGADAVCYLPEDTPSKAKDWVQRLRPSLAIFIKYEFWHYHLKALSQAKVPIVLIAGAFRSSQPFFQWYGNAWRGILQLFDQLGVQTDADAQLLLTISLNKDRVTVTGDPRADRVLELAQTPFADHILEDFCDGAPTRFAGSVWPKDIELLQSLLPHLPPTWRMVIAPHQLHEHQIIAWTKQFQAIRYTKYDTTLKTNQKVLLLDTIGLLSRAYRYGKVAYIGGGFGAGIHNTLEPMAYGLPVLFGPEYQKFPEAVQTLAVGGSFCIEKKEELIDRFRWLTVEENYHPASQAIQEYTKHSQGAAQKSVEILEKLLD